MPVIKNDPMVGNRIPFGDLLPNKAKLNISGDSIDQEVNFTAKQVAIITKDGNVPVGIKKLAVYGKRAGTDVEYVDDNTASKGKALRLVSGKQVRSTKKVAYDQEDTYLVQIRAKEIVSGTIVAGVIGYDGEDPINRNMFPLIKDFVKCTIAESDNPIGSGYVTFNGYISGVGSSFIEPAHATGSPSVIPTGSTSFGVMVKAESGEFYIDSIHVDKVVDITGTSGGQEIIDTLSATDAKFGIFVNVDTFGLNPSDGSVYLYGVQNDGTKIDGDGRIEVANVQTAVPNGAVTTIDNTRNLLLLVGSSVIAARYNPNTAKIENVSGVEQTSGVIIGEVSNNSGACSSALAYAIAKNLDDGKADELQRTFSYLTEPGVDQAEFEARSQAMGIDTFFNFFVAYEAIIRKLYVGNITAGNGDGVSGFRFRVHTYDEITGESLASPLWDVIYNGRPIFRIDPASGDVCFGHDFTYNYDTGTIATKDDNTVITVGGVLRAKSAYFSGHFETDALTLLPGETNSTSHSYGVNYSQAKDIYDDMALDGCEEDRFYRGSLSTDSNVKYISRTYYSDQIGGIYVTLVHWYIIEFVDEEYNTLHSLTSYYQENVLQPANSVRFETAFDITIFTGGDILKTSAELPASDTGLQQWQVYRDGNTLKVKTTV